jgi:RNA-directed DNA polymerase
MKRLGDIYEETFSIPNLVAADNRARKGKSGQDGVRRHDKQRGCNIIMLHNVLMERAYSTSTYTHFVKNDPKPRKISALPFYPDRIVQHAAMIPLAPMFVSTFTRDTYSCIPGRGIHACSYGIRAALKDIAGTRYCLKLDIRQFYPSIDHDILKVLLRRKIKDGDMLRLLDEIIDSAPGVPIGNYLSQYFANFYLSYFDHWLKEGMGVRYYFRYADDMIVLAPDKNYLHRLFIAIEWYLGAVLKLIVKNDHRVFPVWLGIDMVGYVHFHTHVLLRPSIKKSFARAMAKRPNRKSVDSYSGWAKHADTINLLNKILKPYEEIQRARHQIENPERRKNGQEINFREENKNIGLSCGGK